MPLNGTRMRSERCLNLNQHDWICKALRTRLRAIIREFGLITISCFSTCYRYAIACAKRGGYEGASLPFSSKQRSDSESCFETKKV